MRFVPAARTSDGRRPISFRNRSSGERPRAIRISSSATPLLLDGLNDKDPDNRIYVLMALGELKDPGSVWRIEQVTKDPDKDVRKTAYYTLGELGSASSLPELV